MAVITLGTVERVRLKSQAFLGAQVATLLAMAFLVTSRYWQDHFWLGALVLAAAALVWVPELARARARRWWFFYVAGIFLYTLLRSLADETGVPIRTSYVIDVDVWIFRGTDPNAWLQKELFRPDSVTLLDFAAVMMHWSFFIAPHAAAVFIFLRARRLFPKYVLMTLGTLYVALIIFFAVPTTPPWLAAYDGTLPGVFRVMDFVGGRVDGETYQRFYQSLGEPNSVAAMPSLHMGVTFAMFLWFWEHYRKTAPAFLVYSGAMGLALVYLGEHYVFDLVVGIVCATICALVARRFAPPLEVEAAAEGEGARSGSAEAGVLRAQDHLAATDEEHAFRM